MVGLNQLVKGKTIHDIQIDWPRIVGAESLEECKAFIEQLKGQTILEIGRRGKYLIFYLSDILLISHLRMEGKYRYFTAEDLINYTRNKHSHVRFIMTDESQLDYEDVRKFGRMEIVAKSQLQAFFKQKKLGPEPFNNEFHLREFAESLSKINRPIKTVLLEQKVVVGLGNIYVDEALFRARIHPSTPASQLLETEITILHLAIMKVIEKAVEAGGSSIRTYRNSLGEAGKFQQQLKVYGRAGQPCEVCGETIQKIKLGQRGTHFCPHCQPNKVRGNNDDI